MSPSSTSDLARRRLINQRLVGPGFLTPADAVSWFGAVQSQDYAGAKWALGQRMQGGSDAALDRAFDAGEILRLRRDEKLGPAAIARRLGIGRASVYRLLGKQTASGANEDSDADQG